MAEQKKINLSKAQIVGLVSLIGGLFIFWVGIGGGIVAIVMGNKEKAETGNDKGVKIGIGAIVVGVLALIGHIIRINMGI